MKDNIPPEKKLGIYQINYKDCEKIHIERQKEIWKLGLKKIKIKNGEIEKYGKKNMQWIVNQSY